MPVFLKLSGLLLAIFTVILLSTNVFAQEGDILFSDDFNDGDFNGWTIESE